MKKLIWILAAAAIVGSPLFVSSAQAAPGKNHKSHKGHHHAHHHAKHHKPA